MKKDENQSIRKQKKPSFIFTGGGTSGHINPALAIAAELKRRKPDVDIIFTGTASGLEADIVPRHGYEFIPITASPFKREFSLAPVQAAIDLIKGQKECEVLIHDREPAAVVGTGGYVAGPSLAAARKLKIPYLIHEQNAYPGRSNRAMSASASAVCISYAEAKPYFKKAKNVLLTGNPIDSNYFSLSGTESRRHLGLKEDRFFILVSGGSLGARSINNAVVEMLHQAGDGFDGKILLVTGKKLYDEVRQQAAGLSDERIEIVDYLYNMPEYMAAADVYICRAGAGTCAEVAALGKSAIMVPYPYATGDHQTHNARAFQEIGAAVLCPNSEFTSRYLLNQLSVLRDSSLRAEMGRQAMTLAKPHAAETIVDALLGIAE